MFFCGVQLSVSIFVSLLQCFVSICNVAQALFIYICIFKGLKMESSKDISVSAMKEVEAYALPTLSSSPPKTRDES